MKRAIHGAPAEALRQALEALAGLSFWISWTSDPDLAPEPVVSARCMRDAAKALRKAARLLDEAADRADPPPDTARRASASLSGTAPDDTSGGNAGRRAADARDPQQQQPEAEPSPSRAGACRPERAVSRASVHPSTEIRMNHIAPPPEPAIRDIPLCQLALAPENVRKTPPDEAADAQLIASIKSHGLLENLVARSDDPAEDGAERYAVVAGGRRLAALKALAEDGALDADHPVPCKIAANGDAGELSLAENVVRIAMHPADQMVAFSRLAQDGATVAAIAARFVGIADYEAAGGPVLRDLFADEHEHGVWLEDPALLIELAMKKLQAAADELAAWSSGEAMLADWSHLPFEWMEGNDDAACFAALRALPRADKEKLFAAAVARTVKGQLAFEHDARPELEATVARLDLAPGDPQLRHVDRAWASTVHAFQGRTVDTVIAAMEANHPHLTTQKSFYVEIFRARDRAELVTDDRTELKEQLEAVTGERIAALEAVEPESAKGREVGADAGWSVEREGRASQSRDRDRASEPAMEQSRGPKGLDRDLGL